MKSLFNEDWGLLDYNQTQARLVMTLTNCPEEHTELLHNEVIKAAKEYKVETLLCDLSQQHSRCAQNVEEVIRSFKELFNHGVKKIAAITPKDKQQEQKLIRNFTIGLSSNRIRFFHNQEQAINWLEAKSHIRKTAA